MAAVRARNKGAAVLPFLDWYSNRFGAERMTRVLASLPPEHAGVIDPRARSFGLLASQWYSVAPVHALLDDMITGLSPHERNALALESSRHIIDVTIRGVYRLLFEVVASPERYAKHIQRMWDAYYDSGQVTIESLGSRRQRAQTRGWAGHHPFHCEMNAMASVPLFEAMGCRSVTVERTECIAQGAGACVTLVGWT